MVEKLQDLKGFVAELAGQQDNIRITATTIADTTNRLMRDFEAFNEAVKNSCRDLGVANGGFHDKLTAWFGGFQSFKANLHELLLSVIDKLKDAALEARWEEACSQMHDCMLSTPMWSVHAHGIGH